jgi:Tol biopolymer transport system component
MSTEQRKSLVGMVFAMALSICSVAFFASTAYSQTFRQAMGQIAFVSDRDGNQEIWVMNADGTNLRNITNHRAHDWMPTWSPDGTRIAFVSDRDGNWEIYVMNADGTNLRRLTNHPAYDWLIGRADMNGDRVMNGNVSMKMRHPGPQN